MELPSLVIPRMRHSAQARNRIDPLTLPRDGFAGSRCARPGMTEKNRYTFAISRRIAPEFC